MAMPRLDEQQHSLVAIACLLTDGNTIVHAVGKTGYQQRRERAGRTSYMSFISSTTA